MMLDESSYLPYTTGKLPPGPWLVISPHPDDETFGLGGALLLAAEQGIAADVLFLTDGGQGGTEGIESIRENEALEAARRLGIRHVSFWRLPDRSLLAYESVVDRVVQTIALVKPACIFFPSPVEPHPDHRTACVIAWEALRKAGFTAEPWSYEISVQGPVNYLLDISHVALRKRETMAVYASQMTENNYIERIMGLNQARAWSLPLEVSHAEAFYAWPKIDKPLNTLLLDKLNSTLGVDALPDTSPTVSVIIRTKNRPKSLREVIVSVANQTYRDIELIVVNDGGQDVESIVADFAVGSIGHVVYHSLTQSMGRAVAANTGLEKAQGEWVMLLDDDDSISPTHIAALLARAQQRPYPRIVYSGVRGVDAQGQVLRIWNTPYNAARFLRGNFIPIHAVLFQRTLLGTDVRFDPDFDIYEDWDFWSQLARKTPFVCTNEVTATYHLCGDSGTWNDIKKQDKARIKYYAKWLPLLTPRELDESLLEANSQEAKSDRLEAEYAAQVQRYQSLEQAKDAANHQLEAKIAQLKVDFASLEQRYVALEAHNHALEAHNNELSATQKALRDSTSWQITQPLRFLVKALRWCKQFGMVNRDLKL